MAWADRLGIAYAPRDDFASAAWQGGRWVDAAGNAAAEAAIDAAFGAVYASAAADEADRALDDVLPRRATGPADPLHRAADDQRRS